jgi:hypothetical protein
MMHRRPPVRRSYSLILFFLPGNDSNHAYCYPSPVDPAGDEETWNLRGNGAELAIGAFVEMANPMK